jgi:hypothetical protein
VTRESADRFHADAHADEVRAEGVTERVHAPSAWRSESTLERDQLLEYLLAARRHAAARHDHPTFGGLSVDR